MDMGSVIGDPLVWKAVWLSMRTSIAATAIAAAMSIPAGLLLALRRFRGKDQLVTLINTLLSMPTVIIGLFVFSIISRRGPLGELELLYTPGAIVIGQVLLALPIITALTHAAVEGVDERVRRTALTLGAGRWRADLAVLGEARLGILAALVAGFGRVISEVGSASILGGNIEGDTRTITTTIVWATSRGEFQEAAALGLVLLAAALSVNIATHRMLRRKS